MWTVVLIVIMIVLILLVKKNKINPSSLGGAFFLAVLSSSCMGLYAYEVIRILLALASQLFDLQRASAGDFYFDYAEGSDTLLVIEAVVLFILFVPLAVSFIYILYKIIRVSFDGIAAKDKQDLQKTCALRCTSLGIILSVITTVIIFASALMIIPFKENIEYSLSILSPGMIGFIILFTGGLGLPVLFIDAFLVNGPIMMIAAVGITVCSALCIYTVILGISSCVRAARLKAVSVKNAVIAGLFMMILVWNIIPLIYIRSALKKYIRE